jgi:hypothetical protein
MEVCMPHRIARHSSTPWHGSCTCETTAAAAHCPTACVPCCSPTCPLLPLPLPPPPSPRGPHRSTMRSTTSTRRGSSATSSPPSTWRTRAAKYWSRQRAGRSRRAPATGGGRGGRAGALSKIL